MKTLLKVVGVVVLLLVAVIAVAAIVLPMYFDPNDYKDEIAAAVKENTGRELRIQGDVGLSVFPWLGLDMGVVELGNAPGFGEQPFARTEKVNVRVKLMPLLEKRIEMDTVTVHGLALNLARDAKGRGNWEDLAKQGGEAPEPAAREATGPGAPALAGLAVGGLDLRDATLRWNDAQSGQRYTISNLAVQTGALTLGAPVALELDFDVAGGEPRLEGHVGARTALTVTLAEQTYQASNLTVEANLSGAALPGGKASVKLAADVVADLEKQVLTVEGLRLAFGELVATGRLGVSKLAAKPEFQGTFEVAQFSPRKLLAQLAQEAPVTADPQVLTATSLTATLAGGADRITLKPVSVKLDDTTLSGSVGVSDFAKPAIRFDLAVDQIDLDRYLPPPAEGEQPKAASPGAAATGAAQLPLEALRALDVDGRFGVTRLKIAKLTTTDIQMQLKAKDGMIRLNPVSAKLYDGTYAGNIALDARGSEPKISLDERLAGVQAEPLLTDLQGKAMLAGRGDFSAKLSAIGADPSAAKRTLNGEVAFAFQEGAVKGVNIGQLIREARARLRGQPVEPGNAPAQTDFTELTGTVQIKDGVASNQDLSAKSPLLRVSGKGTADLVQETVDYRVTTEVVATSKGQGGKEMDDLAGVPIPIRVTGTFAQPKYQPDMEALAASFAKSKAGAVVEEKKAEVKEKVEQKVQEAVGEKLKGLLGR